MTTDRLSLAHGRNVYRCGFGSFIVNLTCAEKCPSDINKYTISDCGNCIQSCSEELARNVGLWFVYSEFLAIYRIEYQ